ncbi:MAG: hypothetical protein J2P53_01175 [Bradyrhizobiaceae bacterium]|nr:hypothetical protein [Bradyrhizobiaceae bacterium]
MTELVQRTAELGDLKNIWNLMREVAAEVPFDLTDEKAQQSVLSELMRCCTSGISLVALDPGKAIVGAVMARRDDLEWGFRNGNVPHIIYVAVAPSAKGNGVLKGLVSGVQDARLPVYASVKSGEQIGLANELKELGFALECTAANGWGDLYRWQPPANGAAAG